MIVFGCQIQHLGLTGLKTVSALSAHSSENKKCIKLYRLVSRQNSLDKSFPLPIGIGIGVGVRSVKIKRKSKS